MKRIKQKEKDKHRKNIYSYEVDFYEEDIVKIPIDIYNLTIAANMT